MRESRMLLSVSYTQTGALTRISSKLISSSSKLTPARRYHHMAFSIYNSELITTRKAHYTLASRKVAADAFRDNKILTEPG